MTTAATKNSQEMMNTGQSAYLLYRYLFTASSFCLLRLLNALLPACTVPAYQSLHANLASDQKDCGNATDQVIALWLLETCLFIFHFFHFLALQLAILALAFFRNFCQMVHSFSVSFHPT